MPSKRQLKFASMMERELSQILSREIDGLGNTILTLSHIDVTPDLKLVRVYLTALPDDQLPIIVDFLNESQASVRHMLAKRIRHVVKHIPELVFYRDDTEREARKIEELFEKIGPIPEKKDDEDDFDEIYPNA